MTTVSDINIEPVIRIGKVIKRLKKKVIKK